MESKTNHIRVIVSVIAALLVNTAFSQGLDSLIYSDALQFERKEIAAAQLESENELIYVMFDDFDYSVSFTTFNKQTLTENKNFIWRKNADNFYNLEIHVVEYFANRIFVLYSYTDRKTREEISAVSIILTDGRYVKDVELTRKPPTKKIYPISYQMFKSNAGGLLGISSSKEGYRGEESVTELHIFNAGLELVSSSSIALPGSEKIAPPSQFAISNMGIVFFLSGSDKRKADIDGKLGLEKKVYQLYSYNYHIDKLKQFDVSIADKFISDVKMKLHKNGDVYILGFYNNTHTKGAEGVFLMVIDGKIPKVKLSGKKAFSTDVLEDFITGKRLQKNPVIDDLYLDHFYVKDNGNIVFIGEVFYIDKRMINQAQMANFSTSIYYNFDEILTLELDERLNYVQHQTIRKKQRSVNNYSIYYSYSVINLMSDNPLLVYNYVKTKNDKNVTEISGNSRTDLIIQPLFSADSKRIKTTDKVRVSPGINAEFKNGFLVLQNRRNFMISKLVE